MKTINVVSLVAVGSISALLICWSRHDPAKSGASQKSSSGMSVAAEFAGDSTSISHGRCRQATANYLAEGCPANHENTPDKLEHFAGCTATE